MKDAESPPTCQAPADTRRTSRLHRLAIPALLAVAAVPAVTSLLGDSITFDETAKLTAGMSYLETGDFRLDPEHPPLGKLWAAWPLSLVRHEWAPPTDEGWRIADPFLTGRTWLFELNDGERLVAVARCTMVVLLLGLCLSVYAAARTLFGAEAGLLALALAALSPTLLAHGRLVGTDVPVTLAILLTLVTFARLLRHVTWLRLMAAAVALGAATVSKMSWPLVIPALAVMAIVSILRRESPAASIALMPGSGRGTPRRVVRRAERAVVVAMAVALLVVTSWVAIWSCYGWQGDMFAESVSATGDQAHVDESTERLRENARLVWRDVSLNEAGEPEPGLIATMLTWIHARHLLPDAYVFGLAVTLESTSGREAYFCGEHSQTGWRWYFPFALAIKTPIATLALLAAGIVAVARRRLSCADPLLLTGLTVFAVTYFAYVVNSNLNIGHRHLLPVYPVLFVYAGASAVWLKTRLGRWLVPAALAWLVGANLWIHPHYLSYFNELVGGPARGHLYLADSNIDWGQDLKRLARYARQHPGETVKLSYFGSALPTRYGFDCELLPSSRERGSTGPLSGGGLYVISVTQLLGVYDQLARDAHWEQERWQRYYREQTKWLARPLEEWPVPEGTTRERLEALAEVASEEHARQRWGRFLYNLRRHPPDERIGYSLFIYRLSSGEVEELTRP